MGNSPTPSHLVSVKLDEQHGRHVGLDRRLCLVVQPITSGSLVLHVEST
jgi:hypothetical protein